jgi:uncharacterized lipoprotein YmbA
MTTAARLLLALTLPLLLPACLSSTPPSNYYMLSATVATEPRGVEPSIGVGPITIPEYLNRQSMVYSREGNRLHIDPYERWAEPLQNGIARVVSLNLAALLGTQSIQIFPWSASRAPDYGLALNLLELDADTERAALVVEWKLRRPNGQPVARQISHLSQPLDGTVSGERIAHAYSALLQQLAERVAREIRADQDHTASGRSMASEPPST